jgi:fructose-bisphosphate aldolase, class I
MHDAALINTAKVLVASGKGLLAIDESSPTCNKRFAKLNIAQTEENRRIWRELILTTPSLGKYISGVILYDETIRQHKKDGSSFVKVITDAGMIPGIKVDIGTKDIAGHLGEKITEGLDGLSERLAEYVGMGARFAKWRAVIAVGTDIPSQVCIDANAQSLARYAKICQEAGVVPIVEAEVLMDGTHTLQRCHEVTQQVLHAVFNQLYEQQVLLEGIILKPNMVLAGLSATEKLTLDEIVDATMKCLLRSVPAAVPGVAFLSGGQSAEQASSRLNAMNKQFKAQLPWALTFSFGRAIQQPALDIWQGKETNVVAAQQALLYRAKCNLAACRGEYTSMMEKDDRYHLASEHHTAAVNIRQKFVVGNWKMHTNAVEAKQLAQAIVDGIDSEHSVTVVLCPPFPYLSIVGEIVKGSGILLGAQNLYPEQEGAYTGEVSPKMLLDLDCQYVIVGHSERRQKLGESDSFINQKVQIALAAGLNVILCVGETLSQRQAKQTKSVINSQLMAGLAKLDVNTLERLSIAYEPIWAIGNSGHHATPQQAEEEDIVIRNCFSQIFGEHAAQNLAILYGGSVNPSNAAGLFSQEGIDGVLIGADSLNAEQFLAIVQSGVSTTQVRGSNIIEHGELANK